MNPIIFETTETSFDTYGLGVLHPISCFVEEERNGSYELTLTAALTSQHAEEISVGRFIMAKPNRTDDPQPFRVYNVKKALNGTITANARHLSYDLSGIVLSAFTRYNCGAALKAIADRCAGWTFTTDRSAQAGRFNTAKPASARAWLGGRAGSILDLYGPGEWHFDKYACEFLTARGANRGVVIRYGKNLTALDAETDDQNIASKVQCFYSDANGTTVRGSAVATGQTAIKKTLLIDVTDMFETVPTAADLTTAATNYIASHNVTAPRANFTIDWVQSGEIIDRIDLCDTVTIKYEALGISGTAKCIRTKWNVLLDRYEEIEIGDIKTTLADTLVSVNQKIEQAAEETASAYQQAIEAASNIITGAAGGYVVFWNSSTMAPGTTEDPANEILVMDTPSISTATKVWRWNINGLGYSANGYAGPFQTAIDMNGGIATWFIDTVRINADNITAGTITGIDITGTHITGRSTLTVGEVKTINGSDYNASDLSRITQIILGTVTPTAQDYERYDVYTDGHINILDYGIIRNAINNGTATVDLTVKIDGEANADQLIKVGDTKIGARELFTPTLKATTLTTDNAATIGDTLTAAGAITAEGHGSPIGTVETKNLSTDVALSSTTSSVTTIDSIQLTPGTWVIIGTCRFKAAGMMARQVVTIASTAERYNVTSRQDLMSISGENSVGECAAIVKPTTITTYYMSAASAVATDVLASGTRIRAVRIA